MANVSQSLESLMNIDGASAAAVVDANSGMVLGKAGGGVDLDIAGAGNTEVVRAKIKTMKALGIKDNIEDILITLGKQYHVIRPMTEKPGVFIYLVLDKTKSSLALARLKAAEIEGQMAL
jgi:predicted regulator of Ras-like GTPase activity (Roadblock/LC7/MglB family)